MVASVGCTMLKVLIVDCDATVATLVTGTCSSEVIVIFIGCDVTVATLVTGTSSSDITVLLL